MTPTLESSDPEWTEAPQDRSPVDELMPEIPKCQFTKNNVVSNNPPNTPPVLTLYQSSHRPLLMLSRDSNDPASDCPPSSHSNVHSLVSSLSLSPCRTARMTAPTWSSLQDPTRSRCPVLTSVPYQHLHAHKQSSSTPAHTKAQESLDTKHTPPKETHGRVKA
jgi:hypothetical protein